MISCILILVVLSQYSTTGAILCLFMDKNTKPFQLYSLFHPKVDQQLHGLCISSIVLLVLCNIRITVVSIILAGNFESCLFLFWWWRFGGFEALMGFLVCFY